LPELLEHFIRAGDQLAKLSSCGPERFILGAKRRLVGRLAGGWPMWVSWRLVVERGGWWWLVVGGGGGGGWW
jgi:hypothetical protein